MKLVVYNVSGPGYQTLKDGKPVSNWVGVVTFKDGLRRKWFYHIICKTEEDCDLELTKYQIGKTFNMSIDELIPSKIRETKYATAI